MSFPCALSLARFCKAHIAHGRLHRPFTICTSCKRIPVPQAIGFHYPFRCSNLNNDQIEQDLVSKAENVQDPSNRGYYDAGRCCVWSTCCGRGGPAWLLGPTPPTQVGLALTSVSGFCGNTLLLIYNNIIRKHINI